MRRGRPRARPDVQGARVAVDRAGRVRAREVRPGKRIVRIERDRALIVLDGAQVRFGRAAARQISSPKEGVVGLGVPGLTAHEAGQPIRREAKSDLLRDCRTQLLLQSEHAAGLPFVRVRPHVLLIAHPNQLDGHAEPIGLRANRALDEVFDGELPADLGSGLRRAFVPQRSALYTEPIGIDLRQRRAGLVRKSGRQVFAFGIASEVFKGKDCERYPPRRRDARFPVGGHDVDGCDEPVAFSGHRLDEHRLLR